MYCKLLSWIAGPFLLGAALRAPQTEVPEVQLKAAWLYNFTTETVAQWPATAFAAPESPFRIGLMEPDPALQTELELHCKGLKGQGRPIQILKIAKPEDAKSCHLLFLSPAAAAKSQALLKELRKSPLLTIADNPGFCEMGGAVRFFHAGPRLRWEINPKATKLSGISIRGLVLQHARLVETEEER